MNQFPAVDFPSLPAPLAEQYPAEKLSFRLFGTEKEDLAIDFSEPDLPVLVSRVLSQCAVNRAENLPEQFFWDLSVGKRLECLLRLAAGAERTTFSFPFGCGGCGAELELEVSLSEIADLQSRADASETIEVEGKGEKFVFRKPLGRDQKNWQSRIFADEEANEETVLRTMFSSLQVPDEAPANFDDEVLESLEEAFDEADPLVNFNCRADCFECGASNQFQIDLLSFALGELRRSQWSLLYSVHRLAANYHWSESEIFAIPHWRRQQYLSLITDKKGK